MLKRHHLAGILGFVVLATAGTAFMSGGSSTVYACLNAEAGTLSQVTVGSEPECRQRGMVIKLGTTDHADLAGLDQDHHRQYLLVDPTSRGLVTDLDARGNRVSGLAPATQPGDAVPFEQALKRGDAAGGDLGGAFPNLAVQGLQGRPVASAAPADGEVLTWSDAQNRWVPQMAPAAPFSGSYTSPNGQYALAVTDTGIRLSGPEGSITLGGGQIKIDGQMVVHVRGAVIQLNGSCAPVSHAGDLVQVHVDPNSGAGTGTILPQGAATVVGC